MLLRGAKKGGKGKGEEAKQEITTDVLNIYKDKTDPPLLPDSEYPDWLFPMVYEFQEHPLKMIERMHMGERIELSVRDQRRLSKWGRRTAITSKNFNPERATRRDFTRFPNLVMLMPTGEDTSDDPDDMMKPVMHLALGLSHKGIVAELSERLKEQLGLVTKT